MAGFDGRLRSLPTCWAGSATLARGIIGFAAVGNGSHHAAARAVLRPAVLGGGRFARRCGSCLIAALGAGNMAA